MIRKATLLLLIISFNAFAQEGTFSPYSFFGIGNNSFKGTAENRSMGGLSVFSDSIHLNLQNPASYSRLRLTTFSVGATANSLELESNTLSDDINFSTLDYIAVGIPLKKFGIGFGLKPLSAVGYEIQTIDEDIGSISSGRGGVNAAYLSTGVNIIDNLSLGVTANYNFGDIENKNILIQTGIERSSREINSSDINGITLDFGLQHEFEIKKKYTFKTSLAYSPEISLNLDNDRQLATIVFSNGSEVVVDQDIAETRSSKVNFGSKYNIGFGIGEERKWFVGLEYTYQEPSNFDAINFNNNTDLDFVESNQFKFGGFFIPRYNAPRNFFNRIVYRAGIRYNETGMSFRGNSIDEFGMSFGVGLPAGRYFTNINLGFEYWTRGTTTNNLIQENYLSLYLSFSFNDLWFQKPKYN
jgi:long-subunit fatty acid transport protein